MPQDTNISYKFSPQSKKEYKYNTIVEYQTIFQW